MAFVDQTRIAPNAEQRVNDQNPRQRRTVFYARNRWVFDNGQYKVWKKTPIGNDLEVEAANVRVRSNKATASFEFGPVTQRIIVERQQGQAWLEEGLPLVDYTIVQETDTEAVYNWNFGALVVRLTVSEAGAKWSYAYTATGNNTYRIKILSRFPTADAFETFNNRNGDMYLAVWREGDKAYRYNWRDMLPATATVNGKELVIIAPEQDLLTGEQIILDPSFSDDADWGADVGADGTKYPNDGGDGVGYLDTFSEEGRGANKFTISSLPATDTVDQVDVAIYVDSAFSNDQTWLLGPYNGDGQADPEADSGANMFSRCDVTGDYYLTGITVYSTSGQKTHTDLGATANADVEAARDAGTIFSLAWKGAIESDTEDEYTVFREYTHGTNPPALTVTHTAPGGVANNYHYRMNQ